jgi:hypothetical protein
MPKKMSIMQDKNLQGSIENRQYKIILPQPRKKKFKLPFSGFRYSCVTLPFLWFQIFLPDCPFFLVSGQLRAVQWTGPGRVRLVPRTVPREGVQGTDTSRDNQQRHAHPRDTI